MSNVIFENARQARDPRFDGRFFVGVRTTGVYCRPVCPVRLPRRENVTFFPTAAAASEAGFRPCLRCRPEAAPGTPAWAGTSTTVARALAMIGDGMLDESGLDTLCERLGITPRHLSRLFVNHLGASPKAVAQTRRLHFARKLIDETDLAMVDVALSAGYGSVRRFNDHFRQVYGKSPSVLRRRTGEKSSDLTIRLRYRPPYDYDGLLAFLAGRATAGIESVKDGEYRRTIRVGAESGCFAVCHDAAAHELVCRIDMANPRALTKVVAGVRRIFDLEADPMEIGAVLGEEPRMARLVDANPGQRVPGAWDPFELVVRAIVGQQVSVKGARTVMGRIVEACAEETDGNRYFPDAESLANLDPTRLAMPNARATTLLHVAGAVADGTIDLAPGKDPAALLDQLMAIKGIGAWTAQYVAMRALDDPDAFLHSDLVIRRAAKEHFDIDNDKALLAYSDRWRPWRAYACMHLWRQAAQGA